MGVRWSHYYSRCVVGKKVLEDGLQCASMSKSTTMEDNIGIGEFSILCKVFSLLLLGSLCALQDSLRLAGENCLYVV